MGPRAAGPILDRALPPAGRSARRLDVGRRPGAAGAGGDPHAAEPGRCATTAGLVHGCRLRPEDRLKRLLLLLAVVMSSPQPLAAQATSGAVVAGAVRAEVIDAHLGILADDALEGRGTGQRGGE